jgi:hypothetical protein
MQQSLPALPVLSIMLLTTVLRQVGVSTASLPLTTESTEHRPFLARVMVQQYRVMPSAPVVQSLSPLLQNWGFD